MNMPHTPEAILQQIAQIKHLERGKLSVIREGPHGPYYNLQAWENGRNVTRYVPQDQLPQVQANLAAFEQFQGLVEEYIQLLTTQSRAIRTGLKKKRPPTSS